MTVATERVDVDDAEPVLVAAGPTGRAAWVQNLGDSTAWIGGEDVTSDNGCRLLAGLDVGIDLQRGSDKLYAICDTGESTELRVMQVAE